MLEVGLSGLGVARSWAHEASLAGYVARHGAADFSYKMMCGAGTGDLGGSDSAENGRKTGPNKSRQTALRYPATWSHKFSAGLSCVQVELGDDWVPEGSPAEICGCR